MKIGSYEFSNETTVCLSLRDVIFIYLKSSDGRCERIEYNVFQRIEYFRLRLEKVFKMTPSEQILLHAGRVLDEDDKTLFDYGVHNETAITLIKNVKKSNDLSRDWPS